MKKNLFLPLLIIGLFFGGAGFTFATENTLPASNDPFWSIMSNLNRPDDSTCQAKTEALLASLGLPGGSERASATCTGVAGIMQMQTSLEASGVSTNLFSQTDWHHVNDLYFEKTGLGKIEFTKEIDFMSYDFMVFIQTFGDRMSMQQNQISLDADIVESLRTAGAILTMYNVSNFTDPEILVNDTTDTGGVVSNLVYDPTANTIVFDAAHFTSFKAVEKGSGATSSVSNSKKPKISEVVYRKYTDKNGNKKIKVEIKGKHFSKDASIKLGHQTLAVNWKNSRNIEASFTLRKVLKGNNKNPVNLKVINPGEKEKKFHKRIDVTKTNEELN